MGKKTKGGNLGRALIRDRFNHGSRRTVDNNSMVKIHHLLHCCCNLFVYLNEQFSAPHHRSPRWL